MQTETARTCAVALVILLLGTNIILGAQLPVVSSTGPDADAYGLAEHFPVGAPETAFEKKYLVGSFSHFDQIYPAENISPAAHAWDFTYPSTPPHLEYRHAGTHYELNDYLAHLPVTGLLIAQDNQILYEGYQYQRTGHDRFTSQSMSKSIVAMLAGIALSDHALASVADTAAKYVPELKGAPYGQIAVRDLLHMSSGVTCQVPESERAELSLPSLAHDCRQSAPAGTTFRYSAQDSQVLGLIVSNAVRLSLAQYLQQKIWQQIGTEAKATWTLDAAGHDLPFCCFNATLRDYARFARLLAYDGVCNGKQLIPREWLLEATTGKQSDPQLLPGRPAPFYGYGYQVWIFPGPRRMFALLGANGQRIFVDPQSKLTLVQTAVMEKSIDPSKDAETIGLWLSLVHQYRTAE